MKLKVILQIVGAFLLVIGFTSGVISPFLTAWSLNFQINWSIFFSEFLMGIIFIGIGLIMIFYDKILKKINA